MKVTESLILYYPSENVAPSAYLYSTEIGNNSANVFTITHNLNTKKVIVQVQETAGEEDIILADVDIETNNTIKVTFDTAPTANQYRVTVLGGA